MDDPPPPPPPAGDLQCLSWLTSVDVPRLQSRTRPTHTGRLLSSSLPQSILGLSAVSRYAPLFPPPPSCQEQQAFAMAQQCPPQAAMYSHSSYALQQQQTPYAPPHIAPLNNNAQEMHPKHYPKPIYSYSCLIAMALKNSQTGSLPVSEIYSFMKEHFPYFKTAPDGWKNSVRHNLSLNKCFTKVESKASSSSSSSSRKGCLWALNPAKIGKMEEEMQKWKRKDLPAIHRSMANPEELDKLITDRPENCRRKPAEGEAARNIVSRPTQQPPPQPVMALPLPPLSLHHQVQAQSCMAPDSPAPAQTPPLHALHSMGHGSPLPTPMMPPPPPPPTHGVLLRGPDFLSAVMADMDAEVDALDPSIMDFALQGNIWDEIKDESFNLDSLGAFSHSPLPDCNMASTTGLNPACGGSDHSFSDLQMTGLYATYATLDAAVSSAPYLGAQGNKPITLH
ncbi:forkhead box protein N4-like [Anolis carolinensis]|uniref:forkhead box protein N4-like n=1 Tax=Anolis carolinensis TaxID=28377 RepID=UPI002F2B18B0